MLTTSAAASRPSRRAVSLAVCVALVAAVAAVYWPAADFDFVSLDDPSYVFANPMVQGGLSPAAVRWAFSTFHASHWHPLTWLSLMTDCQLFGVGPRGHHVVNIALHAVNAVLLFVVLQVMTGALSASAMVAALFALHPLRVESVAWVTERKDVLSGLFWMTTLLAYVWYVRRGGVLRYLLIAVSFSLGLMAKPMLVSLPLVLLLLDVWPLGRMRLTMTPTELTRLVIEKLPLVGLAAVSSTITMLAAESSGAVGSLAELSWWARLENAPIAYLTYLSKTLWPASLAAAYPHPVLVSSHAAWSLAGRATGAALLLALMSVLTLVMINRRPYLAVGWFWFLGTLVPVIGIVQAGFQAMADRFSYIPLVGIFIAVVWGGREIAMHWPRARPVLAGAAIVVLVSCALVSRRQLWTWRDSVALFEHAIAVTGDNYFAEANLAAVLAATGRADDAAAHYETALAIRPDYATALTGLGTIYSRQGKLDQAAAYQVRALALEPDSPVVLTNLGAVLFQQGKLDDAAGYLERAVELRPDYGTAHTNLGAIYFRRNDFAGAALHFTEAVRLFPDSAAAHNNLGAVLVRQGRFEEAALEFEQALRLQPNLADAQRNLQELRGRLR